jgi:sarcosine oxidase
MSEDARSVGGETGMTHFAVIGRGLIGSAAARYLAIAGHQVTLIGPPEPADKVNHAGVFGSHYDEGRITRALDPDLYWSNVSAASIARYKDIEAQTGVSFFTECGAMIAGPQNGEFIQSVKRTQKDQGIVCDRFFGAVLAEAFPYFDFPDDFQALHEPKAAGYISPRNLVQAQTVAATSASAELVDAIALGLSETEAGIVVTTDKDEISADQVLVAAGGFTNMILPQPLPLNAYARTVAYFELNEDEVMRLSDMPSLVLNFADGRDPYILPPIRYPNGKTYIKIGGDQVDEILETVDDIKAWFKSGGSAEVGKYLRSLLINIIPNLRYETMHTEACMTTFTADERPIISRQSDRITVAVAGCGRGAKCSDELGRRAGGQATAFDTV